MAKVAGALAARASFFFSAEHLNVREYGERITGPGEKSTYVFPDKTISE